MSSGLFSITNTLPQKQSIGINVEVADQVAISVEKESSRGKHFQQMEVPTNDLVAEFGADNTANVKVSCPLYSGERVKHHHFLDLVRETVRKNSKKVYASWYDIDGKCNTKRDTRTFEQIWSNAGVIAYHLRCKWDVKKGQRVILCYDFGIHFFEVFWGCLRAGIVAVLVYPPAPPYKKSLLKLANVVDDCEPALILIDTKVKLGRLSDKANPLSKSRHLWPDHVKFKVTDMLPTDSGLFYDEVTKLSDIAFLQYTSGSTGEPKGVMVTFKALRSNIDVVHHEYYKCYEEADGGIPDEIVGFSWLPQYHDLGLICAAISPFAGGWRMHMMSPISFIKNPLLWLELMSRYKVQWSIAPDFSYALVARKFQEVQALQASRSKKTEPIPGLDLSSISYLTTAAEPCRPEVKDKFEEVFSAYGLREHWYTSAYGLAENVVGVANVYGMHLSLPRLEDHSKVYVACANLFQLHPSLTLKIVNPETCIEVEGTATGELWIAGPTVAAGYYGRPKLSRETFKGQLSGMPGVEFLRTGDLAFIQCEHMYICGRIKDLIIINGANHYPQDVEFAVQDASNAVRPGCVAAFTSNEDEQASSVEVVFEIRGEQVSKAEHICSVVRNAIVQAFGIPVSRVVAIAERSIPKTTSGKIQRRATREELYRGKLKVIHSSLMGDPTLTNQIDTSPGLDIPQHIALVKRGSLPHQDFSSIVTEILGVTFDEDCSWEDLGLSSMAAVELQNQISEKLLVTLPPTFQDEYPTPRLLQEFIENHSRKRLPVVLPALDGKSNAHLGWNSLGFCQVVGVLLILFIVAFSFVPAYHLGKILASAPILNYATDRVKWQWLPLVLPAWILSFSLTVVLAKWVVIGRYRVQEMSVTSIQFLRWWFIDRLVHVWEIWIGNLIKDTPLIWLFYFLMGARLHPLAQIDAFIREFDLVEIGAQTKLQYDINCRRFSSWDSKHGLFLRFRPVRIGRRCKIKGLVSLGASVGDGSHIKELSAVAEGAQVPEDASIEGSPAYNAGSLGELKSEDETSTATSDFVFGALKMLWLLIELYVFFTFLLFGQWLLNGQLPQDFRYTPLLYWTIQLLLTMFLNMVTCVLLKWLLIGKKRAGPAASTLYAKVADWIVDYHFRISLTILDTIAENSKLINVYLMVLGMDIDLASHVWASYCLPSKLDLLSVRRSFFSSAVFQPKQDNQYSKIETIDSSFGHSVVLKAGSQVLSSQIAPFVTVDGKLDGKQRQGSTRSPSVACEMFSIIYIALIFWSAVPAYELFRYDAGDPFNIGFSVVKFATVLVVQTTTWLFLFVVLQRLFVLQQNKESGEWKVKNQGIFEVYMTVTFFIIDRWSLLPWMYGTPLVNGYFKCLGSQVEGRMLFFAHSSYDFPLLTFADRTVVDRCVISGHSVSATTGIHLGPTKCAGTLHEGIVVLAHTDLTGTKETGPCRFVLQNAMPESAAFEHDPVEFPEQDTTEGNEPLISELPFGGDDGSAVSC